MFSSPLCFFPSFSVSCSAGPSAGKRLSQKVTGNFFRLYFTAAGLQAGFFLPTDHFSRQETAKCTSTSNQTQMTSLGGNKAALEEHAVDLEKATVKRYCTEFSFEKTHLCGNMRH